jgi:hypothetical protein
MWWWFKQEASLRASSTFHYQPQKEGAPTRVKRQWSFLFHRLWWYVRDLLASLWCNQKKISSIVSSQKYYLWVPFFIIGDHWGDTKVWLTNGTAFSYLKRKKEVFWKKNKSQTGDADACCLQDMFERVLSSKSSQAGCCVAISGSTTAIILRRVFCRVEQTFPVTCAEDLAVTEDATSVPARKLIGC